MENNLAQNERKINSEKRYIDEDKQKWMNEKQRIQIKLGEL